MNISVSSVSKIKTLDYIFRLFGLQVCTECGLVLEEGSYFAADGAEGTSDVKVNRHLYESSLPTSYLRRNKTETEPKTKVVSLCSE